MKRFLSILLSLTICLTLLPAAVQVQAASVDDLSYQIIDGQVTITDCKESASGSLTIPDIIDGFPVTSIGDNAFYGCSSLTSVTIPDSVTSIGSDAFSDCSSLTSVTIPDSVTSIGDRAFSSCDSLTSVTIGDSVTSIGDWAFCWCASLTSVTIGDSVTSIGDYAFYSCDSLTSVTIPDSVTSIGDYAFSSCDSLTDIIVSENNPSYSSDSYGVLYTKDKATLIQAPGAIRGTYTIPDSVTSIGYSAFSDCTSLTSVTIPDSVTSIGRYAFYNCSSLTSVTIGDSVTSIGDYAFYGCSSLTSVTIPDSVTSIKFRAFYGCSSLQYNVYGAGKYLGNDENPYVFLMETIDNDITAIDIHSDTKLIGCEAFFGCTSLTSVTIPDSVTSIGSDAFSDCTSLTSVTIPDSVTSIGYEAFSDCTSLTSVTIPDSVTSIGGNAFYSCDSLTGIIVSENNPSYSSDSYGVLYTKDKATLIQAPGAIRGTYTIPDSVTSIGDYAFSRCKSFTGVTIPDSVTSIGDAAFSSCDSLTSVTIPDSVTSIGYEAFSRCDSLTSVTIPDSVTSIGSDAFFGCDSLTSVTIPDSVTSIGPYAFFGCDSLTSVTIPDSVTSIGDSTFYSCDSLTSIYFVGNAPSIDSGAFYGVSATAYYHAGTSGWENAAPGSWTDGQGQITLQKVEHVWSSYTYDNNHTCTVDGTERSVCLTCGKTDIRRVEGTADHRFFYTSNNDATCTQDGTKTCICMLCNFTETVPDEGTALDHADLDYTSNNDATCTQDGTKTRKCKFCDFVETVTDEGTALDHADLDYTSNNDATCTQDGTKTRKCKFCDFAETVTDEGTALGHSFTNYIVDNNYTCTVDGTKTAKCDRCDATDIQLDIGSMAHRYYYVSNNDATCTTDGTKTGHCIFCSKTVIVVDDHSALGHSFADGVCGNCGIEDPGYVKPVVKPTLTLKAPALEFKDMIKVIAFFTVDNTESVAEMGMLTYTQKVDVVDVNTAAHVIPGADFEESSGRYFASSQGIHAKYLGDTVYLACYAKLTDGSYVYTKLAPYSPITYATNQLKNSTDMNLKQLCAAMLNYGAAAQNYFGYNTDVLANSTLTDEQKALPESYRADMVASVPAADAAKQGIFANNKGFSVRKPAVSFEGAFSINYWFTPAYIPVDGITLYYWTEADFGAADVLTVDNATGAIDMVIDNNQYRADIEGIAAKDLAKAVYVAAVYSDGTTTWTSGVLGYSIGAYCSSQATKGGTMADLAMATAVYGYHAKAYFG